MMIQQLKLKSVQGVHTQSVSLDETITTISGGKTFEKDNITYTEYTTIKDSEVKICFTVSRRY